MNILHVVPFFYPAWAYGGVPRIIYELCRELVRQGQEVSVYTTDVMDAWTRNTSANGTMDVDGIKTTYFRNVNNKLAYYYNIYLPIGMRKQVKKELGQFDIIQMTGHRNFLNNITHFYSRAYGVPYVFCGEGTVLRQERRIWAKHLFDPVFGNNVLADAAHFIAVSSKEVYELERMGVHRSRTAVIPNGMDVEAFRELPPRGQFRNKYGIGDKKMVLFMGRLAPIKGVGFLVRGFAECAREDVVLVIAGPDMGSRVEAEAVITEKGLQDKVIFTGLVKGQDKLAAYVDADVTVNSSYYEVFGLVLFESLLCGTPVIATTGSGWGETIKEQNFGRIVTYGDAEELGRMINEMLGLSARDRAEMVRRGKEYVVENFSWPRVAGKLIALYERVRNEHNAAWPQPKKEEKKKRRNSLDHESHELNELHE
jgi:glycosyltransferase involved in cell wall biosynthesis